MLVYKWLLGRDQKWWRRWKLEKLNQSGRTYCQSKPIRYEIKISLDFLWQLMERRNSLLYFQWLHKGSSAFRTFLLFVYDKTLLSSHAITFCLHTFFWRVYNENLLLKCSGFTDPTLKLAFPMTSFFKCHLNNAFWDFREQVFSLEFFFRNRKLKGWGGRGLKRRWGHGDQTSLCLMKLKALWQYP